MKVIAITGGGAGIGRGIAWHFARAGYAVSITDRDRAGGQGIAAGDARSRHRSDCSCRATFPSLPT